MKACERLSDVLWRIGLIFFVFAVAMAAGHLIVSAAPGREVFVMEYIALALAVISLVLDVWVRWFFKQKE